MNKTQLKEEIQKIITRAACTKYSEEAAADKIMELVQGIQEQEPVVDDGYELHEISWAPMDENGDRKRIIHSIKRLQDGKVFSIGDKLSTGIIIDTIEESQNYAGGVALRQSDGSATAIEVAKHYTPLVEEKVHITIGEKIYNLIPAHADAVNRYLQQITDIATPGIRTPPVQDKVLLITEDGVNVTDEDQILYYVGGESKWQQYETKSYFSNIESGNPWKVFSTPEARNGWILYNKPCLSQKEIIEKILTVLPKDYKERVEFVLGISTIDKLKQ